ncbi:SAM-dependent methyltransferase, partial [Klebsiella pneumoniae]|nr:SAM-dependent methyltransferase [Klebsiella pneumoniae]
RLERTDLQWGYREIDPDVFGEELLGGAYTQCDRIAAVVLEVTRAAS